MSTRSYYDVLGVDPKAGKAEIERSARRLERLHHPSLNPGDRDAERRFKEVQEAYEVLIDPAKRRAYDRAGRGAPDRVESTPTEGSASGPRDVYVTVQLSFDEAALGCRRQIAFEGRATCGACRGDGCDSCHGAGGLSREYECSVDIPAGVEPGSHVRTERPDDLDGNLVVVTSVASHPFFRRLGDNVHCVLPVSVTEAALGTRVELPTLAGRASLKIPPGTQTGQKLRLRGRGVPSRLGGVRGDMYVEVQVVTPRARDVGVRQLLKKLGEDLARSGEDPRAGLFDWERS